MREIFLRQTNQTWVNASLAVIVNHKSEELQKLLIDVKEAEGYEEEMELMIRGVCADVYESPKLSLAQQISQPSTMYSRLFFRYCVATRFDGSAALCYLVSQRRSLSAHIKCSQGILK